MNKSVEDFGVVKTMVGYEVRVDIDKPISEYAKDFLVLFNNVKTDNRLIRIRNGRFNDVYIVCVESAVDDLMYWLSDFGKVYSEPSKVLLCECDGSFDLDTFDELIVY